jgi:sensor c-di-GMP phosphodiesterase-like protein
MSDPQEQMRQAARDVAQELSRVIDQATRLAKQAGEDLSRLVGDPRDAMRTRRKDSPADLIREIGRLRDEGLITEDEFQAKKADLLARV